MQRITDDLTNDLCSRVLIKIPMFADVGAKNVAQTVYSKLGYMLQHIAPANSGADCYNGRVWVLILVLRRTMAHALDQGGPKCHPIQHMIY